MNNTDTVVRTVHFGYKSIGNFVKLLATIKFEKQNNPTDIAIWHERFDNDESDDIFENFLVELFPEGKTIDVEDIDRVVYRAQKFLETDKTARGIKNKYVKLKNPYWVYFKPDDTVYPCEFAEHSMIVRRICRSYFKGFDNVDIDYLEKFILQNFEIASDNLTVSMIAKDARSIALDIEIDREHRTRRADNG